MVTRRIYLNKPDVFCYICGEYTVVENRNAISTFVKRVYLAYLGMKPGDQDRSWAPHIECKMLRTQSNSSEDESERIANTDDTFFLMIVLRCENSFLKTNLTILSAI